MPPRSSLANLIPSPAGGAEAPGANLPLYAAAWALRAGRGGPRGRGAAVSAETTAPSLEPRPRRRSPEEAEAGEKGALATAPC